MQVVNLYPAGSPKTTFKPPTAATSAASSGVRRAVAAGYPAVMLAEQNLHFAARLGRFVVRFCIQCSRAHLVRALVRAGADGGGAERASMRGPDGGGGGRGGRMGG